VIFPFKSHCPEPFRVLVRRQFRLTNIADAFVGRSHRILNFKAAEPLNILSLQNWVDGNACLAREETAYLARGNELLSVAFSDDSALAQIEAWIEDYLVRFSSGFCKVRICSLGNTFQAQAYEVNRIAVAASQEIQTYTYFPIR
jgi:hypothetical protein